MREMVLARIMKRRKRPGLKYIMVRPQIQKKIVKNPVKRPLKNEPMMYSKYIMRGTVKAGFRMPLALLEKRTTKKAIVQPEITTQILSAKPSKAKWIV